MQNWASKTQEVSNMPEKQKVEKKTIVIRLPNINFWMISTLILVIALAIVVFGNFGDMDFTARAVEPDQAAAQNPGGFR